MIKPAEVIVLQPGYAVWQKRLKAQKADGTISLIKSSQNIVVDTGLPKDKQVILKKLKIKKKKKTMHKTCKKRV